ncbi:MAG: cobalamin B12-binding domain-containing protein [Nitrospirae bacterium]|nr:cobalamin B12-binding domain-containing protein [Nitrospirota bacterium]
MENEKTDIVLVNPPFSLKENFGLLDFVSTYGAPLNLLYLESCMNKANINAKIIDLAYETRSLEECAKYIVSFRPDFVGVAVHFTFLVDKSLKLISLIKKLDPRVKIIVGGVHFSSMPERTFEECPAIDIGILGEAEEMIIHVINYIRQGKPLVALKGVVFRENGKLRNDGFINQVSDLKCLPFPRYDKISFLSYSPALHKEKREINFPIITARGCPFKCRFCDRTVLGSKIRFFDIDYLSEMIDFLVFRYHVSCFNVEDENICITQKRFKEICDLFEDKSKRYGITWGCSMRADSVDDLFEDKSKRYGITWGCSMRADSVDEDTGKMLRKANCRSVTFGIESGSQKMLDIYNKSIKIDSVREKCRIIRNAGIVLSGSFIIGGPGEDELTIEETINLIKKIDLDFMFLWYFVPTPGSEISKDIESKGKIVGGYSLMSGQYVSFVPNTMTREQLECAYKKIYKTFYLKPSSIIRIVKKYGISKTPSLILDGFRFLYRFLVKG